ncbi:AraC family transcriptional regulator [Nocardia sp. CDC153]|uniref:helix-turn-helix transcriptional regulator n=1 Tax=Nocardia sp. CDC153 TaxID=3112167 RepID=UPI002DB6EB4E|nr:AraC family transcriptional regulator [Nocardia sp. CDC153]MEC3956290.1 AraC family transcriptional regulator [Nocardia sp. CDC153]
MPSGQNHSSATSLRLWETLLSTDVVPIAVQPLAGRSFSGSFSSVVSVGGLRIGTGRGGGMQASRTAHHVARTDDRYVVAIAPTAGSALVVTEDRREMSLTAGCFTLISTDRPMIFRIESYCATAIVQVPWSMLLARSELGEACFAGLLAQPLALPRVGAAAIAAGYCRAVAALPDDYAADRTAMATHTVDLLASVVSLIAGERPPQAPAMAQARERVLEYLRQHFADPGLTVDHIAAACSISRSTLYRATEADGGVVSALRRLRLAHARKLLLTRSATISSIAAGCGFGSERQFYRAFQEETGMSPGEFRHRHSR